jgi:hypothetical protein
MTVELSNLRRRFMVIGRRITLNGEHRWVILAAMRLVLFLMRDRHIDRGPVARPDLLESRDYQCAVGFEPSWSNLDLTV